MAYSQTTGSSYTRASTSLSSDGGSAVAGEVFAASESVAELERSWARLDVEVLVSELDDLS